MNLHNHLLLLASLLLLPSLASANPLSLFKLQEISNFPQKCTAAYKVDLTDCTSSEITTTGGITSDGKGVCSLQCIAALSVVASNLNSACAGVQASPTTLIGLFFAGQAVSYLCPNSVEGNGPAPSSTGATATSSTTSTSTTTTATSSSSKSTAQPPPTGQPSPSFQPTTAVNNGVATVLTSLAQQSDSAKTNPDAFGGGGSPFEVAANAASGLRRGRVRNGVPAVLFAAVFWGVLVGCWILVGG